MVSTLDLIRIKNSITRYYIHKGFINSGAQIPDQKITDGTVTIKIIEDRLSKISVSGRHALSNAFIEDRIQFGIHKILDIGILQTNLNHLQWNPSIKELHAMLEPGKRLGESHLSLQLKGGR